MSLNKLKVAVLQFKIASEKKLNYTKVEHLISNVCSAHADVDLLVLPEIFNSPYDVLQFRQNAERIPGGDSFKLLSGLAKKYAIWIFGGSIPEIEPDTDQVYNSCMIFNRKGELEAVHRKVHLFDIDIPGKITFKESKTLTAGNSLTAIKTEFGTIGVGICYDIRFPETCSTLARKHKDFIAMIYPGAFNMTTGPLHWELLLRARAVDNQIFTIGCAPARDLNASYVSWGNSTIVDPYGTVLENADDGEKTIVADLNLDFVNQVQSQIPLSRQRRLDIY